MKFLLAAIFLTTISLSLTNPLYKSENNGTHPIMAGQINCGVILGVMRNAGLKSQSCQELTDTGYAYWKIEDWKSWHDGRAACQHVPGGELMSIHNFEENRLAIDMTISGQNRNNNPVISSAAWIGLYRESTSPASNAQDCLNQYNVWSDGSGVDFSFWGEWFNRNDDPASSQPDCYGEHYSYDSVVQIRGYDLPGPMSLWWNDITDTNTIPSLCKVKM